MFKLKYMKGIIILVSFFLLFLFQSCNSFESVNKEDSYDLFYPREVLLSELNSNCELIYEFMPARYKCNGGEAIWYYDIDQEKDILLSEIVEIEAVSEDTINPLEALIQNSQDVILIGNPEFRKNGYVAILNIYSNRVFLCSFDEKRNVIRIKYNYPSSYDYRPVLDDGSVQ